ncbi:N-acetylneuraminate synthase family protein [bacterium]|nr:N-acetylneuraminate synthase family protein [bacterium]
MFPKVDREGKKCTFLLLKEGYGIERLIKDAVKRGHKVFIKNGKQIINCSLFGVKRYGIINDDSLKTPFQCEGNWLEIEKKILTQTKILGWINKHCGIDVSDIVLPRLRFFIENVCPEILSLIKNYVEFYDKHNIDFVVTPYRWDSDDYAAIALGAKIIEKHITIDKNLEGPDHFFSLEPDDLKDLVRGIRDIEMGLTEVSGRPDEKARKKMYRSIHLARDISKGDILKEEYLEIKRPAGGVEPKYFHKIMGKKVIRDLKALELLQWDDLE